MPGKRETSPLRLGCIFFGTAQGNEPVRKWLKEDIRTEARKVVGADVKTVQATWPVGKPLVGGFGQGLWEVRSTCDKVEYRVVFFIESGTMVVVHGFTKTSKKTRKADIEIALERKSSWEKSR